MSIIADLFSLVGPTPPPAPQGERADAAGFAGMLDAAGERPRGLMGLGRRLAEQSRAETARMDDNGPLVGGEPLINPGLLTGVTVKPDTPQINPGEAGDTKSGDPLINPGVAAGKGAEPLINPGVQTKADGPLINPGAPSKSDGALVNPGLGTKTDQPLVNPGEAVAKDGAQILPGETPTPGVADGVLEALAQTGQAVRADAAAAAVRQAVGRAPEVSAPPQTAEAVMADLEIEAPAVEAASTPAGAAASASSATATGASASTSAQAGPVEQAAARPEAERAADVAPALEGDVSLAEAEAAALPATAEAGAPASVRVDATPVHRMAADAIAQISAQIIRRLEGRATRFDIELNPVELGKVEVRLDIDAEGRLAARLAFDNPAAAADLRGRVDDLRRDLEQAGFQLSEDAFSFADREGARERREDLTEGLMRSFARSAETSDEADLAAQPALRAMARLGLDVRV